MANFGSICAMLAVFTVLYLIAFVIWKPYNSFSRNLSTGDFFFTIGGLATGGALAMLFLWLNAMVSVVDYRDVILQMIFAFIGIRGVRALIRLHYHYYIKRSDNNGLYGLSDMSLLNMELADLLPREPIVINKENIAGFIAGKTVLVTGAAGSIGSELVRNLARYNPSCLVVIDQAETPLHELELELQRDFPDVKFVSLLVDVALEHAVRRIFNEYSPQVVFHAAAYKHVSMMEKNPVVCVLNNVGSTVALADMAIEHGCEKFILISTDKAVNPTGIMGCSKRICEIYCQSRNNSMLPTKCSFITTRFGNVLGSNGSVVPLFREQIRRGGPVTLTHPDVIRYFMLVNEACDLVLEAAAMGHGGEIFVFDMGKPVRIADLAKQMIRISRRSDIKIQYIGLGKGEKLFEEVLADKENVMSTVNEKIKIAKVRRCDANEVKTQVLELLSAAQSNNVELTLRLMHLLVPEFVCNE